MTDWQGAGLLKPSVARLGRIVTAEKTIFIRRLGILNSVDLEAVQIAWNRHMRLSTMRDCVCTARELRLLGRTIDALTAGSASLACQVNEMTDYRRVYIPGATWFFTSNLAERRNNRSLVENTDNLRMAFRYTKARRPFDINAVVVMPDHLHCIWTLPVGDEYIAVSALL